MLYLSEIYRVVQEKDLKPKFEPSKEWVAKYEDRERIRKYEEAKAKYSSSSCFFLSLLSYSSHLAGRRLRLVLPLLPLSASATLLEVSRVVGVLPVSKMRLPTLALLLCYPYQSLYFLKDEPAKPAGASKITVSTSLADRKNAFASGPKEEVLFLSKNNFH